MRSIRRFFALLTTLFAFIITPVQTGSATTMIYRSVQELTDMSDSVVRGTILSHHSFWSDEGTMFTDWTVRVEEVLQGDVSAVITLRQMGGQLDDLRMHIPGDATFVDGEHVVLFLREVEGIHYLTLMGQAKLAVSLQGTTPTGPATALGDTVDLSPVDATLVRDLTDLVFYRWDGPNGGLFHLENEVITLSDLRRMASSRERGQ